MNNIQGTVDEETLRQVDRLSKTLGLTRSELTRRGPSSDWTASVARVKTESATEA